MYLQGIVVTGQGQGRYFTILPWARAQFIDKLGIDPYPGTLNLRLTDPVMQRRWQERRIGSTEVIRPEEPDACAARGFPVEISGSQPAAIIWPQVDAYPEDQIELIAAVNLRQRFGLSDGVEVWLQVVSPAEARRRAALTRQRDVC